MTSVLETLSCSSSDPQSAQPPKQAYSKPTGDVLLRCSHCIVVNGRCFRCKKRTEGYFGKAFGYLGKGVRLSDQAARALRRFNSDFCFGQKKLHLVLDLDRTLIHGKNIGRLRDNEKDLMKQAGSRTDLRRIELPDFNEYLVKLRPFVSEFLRRANELFEMFVYTMGSQGYAERIVRLLDPQDIYFGPRVITRKDSRLFKTLDLVLAEERGVVIVDDTPNVWPGHLKNLITVPKYVYFHESCGRSCLQEGIDEEEMDGPLAAVLKRLEKIHQEFFKVPSDSSDVRVLI